MHEAMTKWVKGKRVTVLGAARSGIAVSRLLSQKGADVFLSEYATQNQFDNALLTLQSQQIECEFGGHTDRAFKADAMVVSPGISENSPVIQHAKKLGLPVWGELEVSGWFCQSPIVAITGSNGKSTTTALLGEIFKNAGWPTLVVGNIGQAFSEYVDNSDPKGVAVVEVSSFQLETIEHFHPKVAVYLNLTPDHLDRHGTMEYYGELKARLFENQDETDYAVYNGQDPFITKFAETSKSRKAVFGIKHPNHDWAIEEDGNLIVQMDNVKEELIHSEEMMLKGPHNVANGLAAALAARHMGVDFTAIRKALRHFEGLAHRMEFIRERNGVGWVNDSKATNVDSMQHALRSFSRPIILIAGGKDKDSDFNTLREIIKTHVRNIILIGDATEKMEKAFDGTKPIERASSLEEAVQKADDMAMSGDVVLLSPGCASFDMFENFEDRGDQFKNLVKQLQ